MANYYNVAAYRRTGYDFFNRPESRECLNDWNMKGYDIEKVSFIQGIALNREDFLEITYIDLQGSVKDFTGEQLNSANAKKDDPGFPQFGGPFYSWEDVDYIRLTRTGYPGDPDFVDINMHTDVRPLPATPWAVPVQSAAKNPDGSRKKLRTAYYFVTGMKPLARNVTRLFLMIDIWLTLGGLEEITFLTGYKVRGHITDAEDAKSYNMSPEKINAIYPMRLIKGNKLWGGDDSQPELKFVYSNVDLTHYTESDTVEALIAQGSAGDVVNFPKIPVANAPTNVVLTIPANNGVSQITKKAKNVKIDGLYNPETPRVAHNMSILYSAGQLELQDSFKIPRNWLGAVTTRDTGWYSEIKSFYRDVPASTHGVVPDITGYPRKADYMYGEYVVWNEASGDFNNQSFSDVNNNSVIIWSNPVPGGLPYARIKGINNRPVCLDQVVRGQVWQSNEVRQGGAAGAAFAKQQYILQDKQRKLEQLNLNKMRLLEQLGGAADTLSLDASQNIERGEATLKGGLASLEEQRQGLINFDISIAMRTLGGLLSPYSTHKFLSDLATSGVRVDMDRKALAQQEIIRQNNRDKQDYLLKGQDEAYKFALGSMQNKIAADNLGRFQAMYVRPYVAFTPDFTSAHLTENAFYIGIINTGPYDRQRLKNYFKKWGYSGLYEPLTKKNILVKKNVNYIQAEGCIIEHPSYSKRYTQQLQNLFATGFHIWNGNPLQSSIDNNPDR